MATAGSTILELYLASDRWELPASRVDGRAPVLRAMEDRDGNAPERRP